MSDFGKCRFCGQPIENLGMGSGNSFYMHTLSVDHRAAMDRGGRPVVRRATVPLPSPYEECLTAEKTGPMHKMIGPMVCQGCRQHVDAVRYLGRVVFQHPSGALACPASVVR